VPNPFLAWDSGRKSILLLIHDTLQLLPAVSPTGLKINYENDQPVFFRDGV